MAAYASELKNGAAATYTYSFEVVSTDYVRLALKNSDGVFENIPTDHGTHPWTIDSATSTITMSGTQFPSGTGNVRVSRDTPLTDIPINFNAGSSLTAAQLNENFQQTFDSSQEVKATFVNAESAQFDGTVDINSNLIINSGDIVFEGTDHDTTLTIAEPGAARTITLPNVTGTVITTGDSLTIATGMIANDAINGDKIADNAVDSEHYTDGSIDLAHMSANSVDSDQYVDGSIDRVHLAADIVDGTKIADNSIDSEHYVDGSIDAEHYAAGSVGATALGTNAVVTAKINADAVDGTKIADNAIDSEHYTDGSIDRVHLAADIVDGTKLADNAVDSEHYTDGSIDRVHLAADIVDGTKIADDSIDSEHYVDQSIDAAHLATSAVTTGKIAGDAINADKIADDAVGAEHINGLTASITELNQLDGNTLSNSGVNWTSGTTYPSASQISARLEAFGGFEAIADDESFPNTAPAEGVIISIANAGGLTVNGSGVSTNGDTLNDTTVTINNFPSGFNSTTLDDGIGLLVVASSTAHTYNFHRVVAKDEDVRQLSSDINDFKARYRTGTDNPTTDNDAGDLFFNTGSNKMLVRNGDNDAWEEVQSIGEYFIIPSSDFPTWNGTLNDISITSNAPANAEQIILSINGVIQEPNSGTGRPTDGFSLNGSTIQLSAAPATGSEAWGVIVGSTVNIGTPSAGTVGTTQLANDGVTYAKMQDIATANRVLGRATAGEIQEVQVATDMIADDAVTAAKLADTSVTAGSYTLSSITVDDQGRITAASSGSAGDSDKIEEGDTNVECVDTGSDGHILFDTEGSERMRVDSSGRLLMGTSTAPTGTSSLFVVQGLSGNTTEQGTMRLQRSSNNGNNNRIGVIEFGGTDEAAAEIRAVGDGTWGTDDYPGRLEFRTTADGASSTTERMRIDNSGNVGIGVTNPLTELSLPYTDTSGTDHGISFTNGTIDAARIEMECTGTGFGRSAVLKFSTMTGNGAAAERMRILDAGGITFNGDTATANALDDYEEGTFTPTITAGYNGVSFNTGYPNGNYTKIGDLVFIVISMYFSSTGHVSSARPQVGGLPFTAHQTPVNSFGGVLNNSFTTIELTSHVSTSWYIGPNGVVATLFANNGSSFNSYPNANANNDWIQISGCYKAA